MTSLHYTFQPSFEREVENEGIEWVFTQCCGAGDYQTKLAHFDGDYICKNEYCINEYVGYAPLEDQNKIKEILIKQL